MSKRKDLTGQTFGGLVVLSSAGVNAARSMRWKCQCGCGNITVVDGRALRVGATKSCGCFQRTKASALALGRVRNHRRRGIKNSFTTRDLALFGEPNLDDGLDDLERL